MLIHPDRSTLLVIDVQERLQPFIEQGEAMLDACCWLVQVAKRLGVPVICTEQYPRGLGATVPALRELLGDSAVVEKIYFSAVAECGAAAGRPELPESSGGFLAAPGGERRQFVVVGSESHVCVQQTVLDLLALGREVFVVEEAVGSRRASDKALALDRMRRHGADIVSREMVAFEWLQRAGTETFRAVSREFIR
ncbi:isochorismatase family protein [Rhodocyclus gracilis]|uniref:Isochorismatase family protein n=1 Tax=Rhodocyclus tenuis TaxID=1066 RepID=A0A6L5JUC3_RHOTE|nr:isochorismatase family protein [Rhodocyclus gracilis]